MNEKHGLSKSRLYSIWHGMRDRCYRKNHDAYPCYGARGIRVCDDWNNSFIAFHAWAVDNGYRSDKSIDRIDGDGNYCPENCRWATSKMQARNKARPAKGSLLVDYRGERLTLSEWSRKTKIGYTTLVRRFHRGVRGAELFHTPQKAVEYFRKARTQTGNGKAKLQDEDVAYIAQSETPGAELARRFNVSQSLISMIRRGHRRAA